MSQIKVLKFVGGIPREINSALDDIVAKTFVVGGTAGTALTKAILDTLSSGSSDASSLHNHDTQYWRMTAFLNSSAGGASAALPIKTDARGKFDPSFYVQSDITHGNLSGLASDDHVQYHNNTRGDARYYTQAQYINASTGVSDAGKPVKTAATGKIDPTLVDVSSSSHNSLSGLQGGQTAEYYHLTAADYATLRGGSSDASALHNHNTQYYTKAQSDTSLAAKADDNVVIKKNGTVPFTANQPMGGFKLTGLADGSANSDSTAYHQLTDGLALKVSKAGDTMSGALNMGGNLISGLATGVSGTDAVNVNQLNNAIAGQTWRKPVVTINTSSTTLPSGTTYVFDGVTHANGNRVLFTALSIGSANYRVYKLSGVGTSISWALEIDGQAGDGSPTDGDAIYVQQGTANGDTQWNYNGTAFVQFSGAGQIQAGIGLVKSGNTLSVALGAGIQNLPNGEVGIDLYTSSGLDLIDPSSGLPSVLTDAQLSAKLADGTLTKSSSGLAVGTIQSSNIAALAVTTAKIAANAVTSAKLSSDPSVDSNRAVTTDHIQDAAVTNAKISSVDAAKITTGTLPAARMPALTGDVATSVGTVATTIQPSAVTTGKIAANAVDSTKILFGTTGSGVRGADIPLADTLNQFVTKNVAAALSELANADYIETFTAGETIGQYDAVVLRRDSSNVLKAYRASAASTDNYVSASLILQDITYTAAVPAGNNITVQYTNPGAPSSALSVSVSGNAITVFLATNGSSALTSTAAQIQAAVAASGPATALVTAAVTGTSSAIQAAAAATLLFGGMDYNDNGRWMMEGIALDAAASNGSSFRVQKSGALTCNFLSAPTAADIGKSVYLAINLGKVAVNAVPSSTNDGIILVGRLRSTTQIEFKAPQLMGVNG